MQSWNRCKLQFSLDSLKVVVAEGLLVRDAASQKNASTIASVDSAEIHSATFKKRMNNAEVEKCN